MSKITAADIRAALRNRYCAPEWCLMQEVANGTGAHGRRYADAIAMNLFPSRGLAIHGVEIKVSLGDLKKELLEPEKAAEIAQYCDYWYLAVSPGLTDKVSIPLGWGVLELGESGCLREKIKPQRLDAKQPDRTFVAALARRINQQDNEMIESIVERRISPIRAAFEKKQQEMVEARDQFRDYQHNAERYLEIAKTLNKIKQEIGVDILGRYKEHEKFLRAAEFVNRLGIAEAYGGIKGMMNTLKSNIKDLESAYADLKIGEWGDD